MSKFVPTPVGGAQYRAKVSVIFFISYGNEYTIRISAVLQKYTSHQWQYRNLHRKASIKPKHTIPPGKCCSLQMTRGNLRSAN